MTVSCEILIHKPSTGTHRAGQPVTGVVKYNIENPIELKDIVLSFKGRGKCSWSESTGGSNGTQMRDYSGSEEYMCFYLNLLDKKNEDTVTLPAGTWSHDFTFILPSDAPSSFKDGTCSIKYRLKLNFIRPELFKANKKFYAELPVYSHFEAGDNNCPIVYGLKKTLIKPLSSKKHTVTLRAEIDKSLLSPGDEAKLSYVITNGTNVEIKSVKTEIINTMTYTASCGHKKKSISTIRECVIESPSVPMEAIAKLSSVIKVLPDMYSIENSKIINREYKIKASVRLPLPYVNTSVDIPIVIGIRGNDHTEEMDGDPPSYWEAMSEEEKCKDV